VCIKLKDKSISEDNYEKLGRGLN